MAKYLVQGHYTSDGLKGLLKEGGNNRREAIEQLVASAGGQVEVFYYAFGQTDLYIIVDIPDNVTMAALSMMVSATGAATSKITVLLTADEIDQAANITASYRPPGAD